MNDTNPERLKWEEEFDCLTKMRQWMMDNRVVSDLELAAVEKDDYATVEESAKPPGTHYLSPIIEERNQVMDMIEEIAGNSNHASELRMLRDRLANLPSVTRRDIHSAAHEALRTLRDEANPSKGSFNPMEK